jgi:hypothetical protein
MKIADLSDGQLDYLVAPLTRETVLAAAAILGQSPEQLVQRHLALRILMGTKRLPRRQELIQQHEAALRSGDDDAVEGSYAAIVAAIKAFIGAPSKAVLAKHPEYGLFVAEASAN